MTTSQCLLIIVSQAQDPKGHLVQQSVVTQSPARDRLVILAPGTKVTGRKREAPRKNTPCLSSHSLFPESWMKEGERCWRAYDIQVGLPSLANLCQNASSSVHRLENMEENGGENTKAFRWYITNKFKSGKATEKLDGL